MGSLSSDTAILESNVPPMDLDLATDLTEVLFALSHYSPALYKRSVDAIRAVAARVWSPSSRFTRNTGLVGIDYEDGFEITFAVSEGCFIAKDIKTGITPGARRARLSSYVWRNGGFLFFDHSETSSLPSARIERDRRGGFRALVFRLPDRRPTTALSDGARHPTGTVISVDITLRSGPDAQRQVHGAINATGLPGETLGFTWADTELSHGSYAQPAGCVYPGFDDGIHEACFGNPNGDLDMRDLFLALSGGRQQPTDRLNDDSQSCTRGEIFVTGPARAFATGDADHIEGKDVVAQDWYRSGAEGHWRPVDRRPLHDRWAGTDKPVTSAARPHADVFQTASSTSLCATIDSGRSQLQLRADSPVPLQ